MSNGVFVKGLIFIGLSVNLSPAKVLFTPESGEASSLDSIFIHVPGRHIPGKQIIHRASPSERQEILKTNRIEVVNIFNGNGNDTLDLVETQTPHFKNWNTITIFGLDAGTYEIFWEGREVGSYEIVLNIYSANRIVQENKKKSNHKQPFGNENRYSINGQKNPAPGRVERWRMAFEAPPSPRPR